MALAGSDLLVVQKQTGGNEIRSLTITDLGTFLGTDQVINFKGTADMTVAGDEPPAEDRVNGNLYVNSASSAGTFAWSGGTSPYTGTVQPNAQAIWVTTVGWQVTNNNTGDIGVVSVDGSEPIEVDSSETDKPIVSILTAQTTRRGSVQLATNTDVENGTPDRVVTADQLFTTNQAIGNAGGGSVTGVTGTAPIVIESDANVTPRVTITAATTSEAGSCTYQDVSEIKVAEDGKAATPAYVDSFYLIKNFASLDPA